MTNVAPGALVAVAPSQDDRLLAACSHLSFLVGFPVVAPIAIYVIKRRQSRFVGFHAVQAAVAHLLFGTAMALGFLLLMVASWVAMIAGMAAISTRHELGALVGFIPLLGLVAGLFALFAVQVYAAYAAWCGESWSIPIAGRIARAIQSADEGAAKA